MISRTLRAAVAIAAVCVFCGEFAIQSSLGVPVTLTATEDNTLYEENGNFSNGRGEHIYVGTAQASNWTRRALIGFDLTNSGIPSGATINSVTLRLFMDRVGSSFSLPTQETLSLHRMTADWGEGASDAETGTGPNVSGGRGIAAQAGDATWQFRVVPGVAWGTTGGDFVAAASASRQVPRTIPAAITWSSDVLPDDTLVSDVQGWLDNPATNFGWILRGDESTARSATRFASRNHPTAANRPMLTIDYTVPATRLAGDVDNDRDVDLNDLKLMTASLGLNMGATQNDGDFTGAGGQPDGRVGIRDLLLLRNNFGQTSPSPSEAAVPEPAAGAAGLVVVAAVFTGLARRRRRLTG